MKKSTVIGVIVGFAAGAAAAIAGKVTVDKVIAEIKNELEEQSFVSPEGGNLVTVSYGDSATAKGLTYIRVKATTESGEDSCKLVMLARKKPAALDVQWADNDHFKLLVGHGKRKQCCDVSFGEKQITATYYWVKG